MTQNVRRTNTPSRLVIEQASSGYRVKTANGRVLGTATTVGPRQWVAIPAGRDYPLGAFPHGRLIFGQLSDAASALLSRPDRAFLYCLPGHEHAFYDPSEVIEDYEWMLDDPDVDPSELPTVIEKWSTYDSHAHLVSPDALLDWMSDWTAECGEIGEECDLDAAFKAPEVRRVAEQLVTVVAEHLPWRMCKEKLEELPVVWDGPDGPTIAGVPAWVPVDSSVKNP